MPAEIAHILCGEECLSREAPAFAAFLGGEADADLAARWFRLGCQGPDFFYHNQRTKPSGLHLGALAHRRGYGLLVEGALASLLAGGPLSLDRAREKPARLAALAWLLGFSTHAALDRALHPYIVCFAGWVDPSLPDSERYRSCHPFLERLLDLAILEHLRGEKASLWDFEALLPLELRLGRAGSPAGKPAGDTAENPADAEKSRGPEEAVTALVVAGLRAAYPRATAGDFLLEKRVVNALTDARYFLRMTNPARTSGNSGADYLPWLDDRAGPRSVALVHPERLPATLDLLNSAGTEWPHPAGDGRSSRAGVPELFDAGLGEAAASLRAVLESIESGNPLPGLAAAIGDGGLSITDARGQALAPRLSRPLPLAALLRDEYAARLEHARRALAEGGNAP